MEKVKRIEVSAEGLETKMTLWIYRMDEFQMKDCPYDFKWFDHQVIFMYGGWSSKEARPIGTAQTLEDAKLVASEWLERHVLHH
jgi:hypothetical protein